MAKGRFYVSPRRKVFAVLSALIGVAFTLFIDHITHANPTNEEARTEIAFLFRGAEFCREKKGAWLKGDDIWEDLEEFTKVNFNRNDPWLQPYLAKRVGADDFEIRSIGADGIEGTPDDIYFRSHYGFTIPPEE